jgi:hypothetical protein
MAAAIAELGGDLVLICNSGSKYDELVFHYTKYFRFGSNFAMK